MASDTGGVKPFPIQGRLASERERLLGMTNEERAYRRQWLKDQVLSSSEPRNVPELLKERLNPIRRAYRMPLDVVFKALTPILGENRAFSYRWFTGKFIMIYFGIVATNYYFKYNANDWTKKGGWRVITSRPANLPGRDNFPKLGDRSEPRDYAARGFKDSPI